MQLNTKPVFEAEPLKKKAKMEHSQETVGGMQLDEYVTVVPRIYSTHDQNRSIWDVWCHTLHHGASVAERLRKNVPDKLLAEVADFALWLFTTVYKLSGQLGQRKWRGETAVETLIRIESTCSDLVWHRYPGVCHLCYARRLRGHHRQKDTDLLRPCDCSEQGPDFRDKNTKRADSRDLEAFSEIHRSSKPKTIDEWQSMFAAAFRASIHQMSTAEIGLHLMEELGEVSDALVRMYSYKENDFRLGEPNWRQARLERQIADVFSWLFALVEKLNDISCTGLEASRGPTAAKSTLGRHITLSEIIWKRYGSDRLRTFRCPACNKAQCACRLVFVPATRPLKELLAKFEE